MRQESLVNRKRGGNGLTALSVVYYLALTSELARALIAHTPADL
jgi:hypothetical protein